MLILTVLNSLQAVYSQIHYINDEGELYSAVSNANSGDTLMFSLSSYPSNINISSGFHINKKITIIGPTTEKITLEGSSDEFGGTQLFYIASNGDLTLKNLTLKRQSGGSDNSGQSLIYNGGNLKILNSLLHNVIDSTTQGSVIYNGWDGNLHIENSTFSNNYGNQGGAIYSTGELTIISSTFYNNFADNVGGGIFWHANGGNFTSLNSLYYNSSCYKYSRIVNSMGYNASNDLTYNFNHCTDFNNVNNIYLNLLHDNGGPTFTHSLADCSIALDNGDPNILANDQRGMPVYNGRRDIGSYEKQTNLLKPAYGVDIRFEPSPFQWIDGNIYTDNDTCSIYILNGMATNGCDSIVTLNLSIISNIKSLGITNNTFNEGQQAVIRFSVSHLSESDNIISYQFDIDFDNAVLEYASPDLTGTIAEGGTVEVNTSVDGKLSISYMNSEAIVGEGDILILQFNPLAVGTTQVSISNAFLNNIPIDNLTHGTIIIEDVTPPTAAITYSHDNIRYAHELLITSTFSEPMSADNAVLLNLSGAASLAEAEMTRVSETVYTYTYTIPKTDGEVTVSLSNGTDLWGNEVVFEPTSGGAFTIIGITYGDVDGNNHIQAYDAALTLQYSVGLDPLPNLDPLPWETWRIETANVDGVGGVTANDASLILKYSARIIDIFPVEDNTKSAKSNNADVIVTYDNGELIFISTGELFGLNIFVESDFDLLGRPVVYAPNMMQSSNISATSYAIGLATAYAPEEGKPFLKIPFTSDQPASITFDMVVNSEEKTVTVDIVPTGIENINEYKGSLYPNPARDVLFVNDIKPYSTIEIYDMLGKRVMSKTSSSTKERIDISSIDSGIYLVNIDNGSFIRTLKFVKR